MICVSLPCQIWDFPGQIDFFDPAFDSEHIFGGCGALIFVIDAQVSPGYQTCRVSNIYGCSDSLHVLLIGGVMNVVVSAF